MKLKINLTLTKDKKIKRRMIELKKKQYDKI